MKQMMLGEMLDISNPEHVEISIRDDGRVIWVNVDGACVLRVCRIPILEVADARKERQLRCLNDASSTS
jgi:hypothetical protein